ncbi:PilN domain-containing protein [Paraburkholderia kururiensis]|uniref:PilN domain-containing protein n=1 Tax=Paraburkholderia kururiensis TaxID=984307 RepID=UPI0003481C3F|nr:PilN domain-containing protein [Paraburkholderia kururiensis]
MNVNAITRAQLRAERGTAWMGGFNLLPWRRAQMRRARRRCLLGWACAAALGGAGVIALGGWQVFERMRVDAQRAETERSLAAMAGPLAEHDRLARRIAGQRERDERAVAMGASLAHLLDFLAALSREASAEVAVQRLVQHDGEIVVTGEARDHAASAEWLERLRDLEGVRSVSVSELKRAEPGPTPRAGTQPRETVQFTATVRWDDAPGTPGEAQRSQRPGASHENELRGRT